MQILLANAKIMLEKSEIKPETSPLFQSVTDSLALEMSSMNVDELMQQLKCNRNIALENWKRYQHFFCTKKIPAIMAYDGMAYKHLQANSLDHDALIFAQKHLWITCFLYGLLRPLDGIVPYRMEHGVRLNTINTRTLGQYWKDILTDVLIDSVKKDDGVLIHLSTKEYEQLFDWNRVKKEIKIIQPLFYVQKEYDLKMQVVWAKACRGAMTRFILENQISNTEELYTFSYKGYKHKPSFDETAFPLFIKTAYNASY